jgi:hypothetical protein
MAYHFAGQGSARGRGAVPSYYQGHKMLNIGAVIARREAPWQSSAKDCPESNEGSPLNGEYPSIRLTMQRSCKADCSMHDCGPFTALPAIFPAGSCTNRKEKSSDPIKELQPIVNLSLPDSSTETGREVKAMTKQREFLILLFILSLLVLPATFSAAQGLSGELSGEEGILVGRISHVEGSVFRYIPEEGAWVQVGTDSPFGLEDKLRSNSRSRAEVILPNNTWFRMDGDTHLHLLSLQTGGTEMHMVHGSARFMNKGSHSSLYVTTPFGEVSAPAQTSFDLYVGDASMEVVSLKGSVYFSRDRGRTKTEVVEGSAPLIADSYAVTAGQGSWDASWNAWNLERDALWARRMRGGRVSAKYLPSTLHDHAYALDDYGAWQRVYYDGAYGYLWRPLYVTAGWAPYTAGRWSLWYGDHVWLPREPFGYVTHHYGTWVYTGGYWYWAPPVASFSLHLVHPSLRIGFAWYPGRVAWFHSGAGIGWIPLAPHEPYYARRRWGPRSTVVKNVTVVNIHVRNYRNERRAVMIDKGKLHTADNYRTASIKTVDRRALGAGIQARPAVDQRKAVRNPVRESPIVRSRERGRLSQPAIPMRSTNRQSVQPRTAGGQKAAAPSGNRISERKPGTLTRNPSPQRNTRQLPAGPQVNNRNRLSPAPSRPSSVAPQVGAASPRTRAPAAVRQAPERRPPAQAGPALRTKPQPGQHRLQQANPEAARSPNARIQRQRGIPENVQSGNRENSNRGRQGSR